MERIKKIRIIFLLISILLFIVSLSQTAIYADAGHEMGSLGCLLFGWMDVFGDSISWLANPFLLISWFFIAIKQGRIAIFSNIIALIFMLLYLSNDTIITDEGGNLRQIISYGAGYYLWMLSCVFSIFASIVSFYTINNSKIGN